MITKCNNCWSEHTTESPVLDLSVYHCEVCGNKQILINGVWKNVSEENIEQISEDLK